MNQPREVVSVALFSLFAPLVGPGGTPTTSQPFAYGSRFYPAKAIVEGGPIPAFYLIETDENDDEQQVYAAQRYILRFKLIIYATSPNDGVTAPGTILNPLLDAVDQAMQKTPSGTPLNGSLQQLVELGQPPLVANAWINGRVSKSYTELSQANFVIVPITVLTGQ